MSTPDSYRAEWTPPSRLLLGPGPSMVHPRVLRAMALPLIGHLDPAFVDIMDEIQHLLRQLFRTRNPFTVPLSGTGSAGMEAALVNVIVPGDRVLVGIHGVFGTRLAAMVERCGGIVIRVEAPWGSIVDEHEIERALHVHRPVKAVALVHAETSTGVLQPLDVIAPLCRAHDALLILDTVTSLGGLPVEVDHWGIDVCYSGTQKCLSCPPGLAPVTVSDRALAMIKARPTPCHSWYLDFSLIAGYWISAKRVYHHTAPISMLYALREALRLIDEEGLETRFARHQRNSRALMAGLEALGFSSLVPEPYRLPTLHAVIPPPHVDDVAVRRRLLSGYGIEIGGGLGPLEGKIWRIGLMGESSTPDHVFSLLGALDDIWVSNGWRDRQGRALEAASEVYRAVQGAPA